MSDPVRAVIDRIVDDRAVVLVGKDESEVHVPTATLPDGAEEGTVVLVELGDEPRVVEVDERETDARHAALADRLDHIRRTRGSGRFDGDDGRADHPSGDGSGC